MTLFQTFKFFHLLISLLALVLFLSNGRIVKAECGSDKPDDLDSECNKSQCGGSKEEVKGCYLPPEPGKKCPEEYPNEVDICCCI